MISRFLLKIPKAVAILLIRMYQALHGSFFMGVCRFEPTCSHYAVEAIETRGLGMGILLTAGRIARCQPFCKGGWDPVPRGPVPAGPVRYTGFTAGPLLRGFGSAGNAGARNRVSLAPHSPLGESLE
jgi:putative membrane protein insertion efficiency factor